MQIILRSSLGVLVLFTSLLAIFPCVNPAPALAGTTTLVTYYPAPNGNYSKVTLYPQAQPSGVCRSGAMYVDNTTGAFNYCVDSNINPNGGGLIGGVLAGTGAWGNLQTVNPVHYYDVANKGYVDAASSYKCFTAYASCPPGFTNYADLGPWGICWCPSPAVTWAMPPGAGTSCPYIFVCGGGPPQYSQAGEGYLCCK